MEQRGGASPLLSERRGGAGEEVEQRGGASPHLSSQRGEVERVWRCFSSPLLSSQRGEVEQCGGASPLPSESGVSEGDIICHSGSAPAPAPGPRPPAHLAVLRHGLRDVVKPLL